MKILLVYPFFPYFKSAHGTALRMFHYLKHMSKNNEITLCCFVEEPDKQYLPSIKRFCKAVYAVELPNPNLFSRLFNTAFSNKIRIARNLYSAKMLEAIKRCLENEKFDIVHFELVYMYEYLKRLKNTASFVTILSEAEIMSRAIAERIKQPKSLLANAISLLDALKIKDYEVKAWMSFDKILAISEVEKQEIQSLCPEARVEIFPNGVDVTFFDSVSGGASEEYTLIYTGNFWHYPNEDAMLYFYKNIFLTLKESLPKLRLLVVGKNPTLRIKNIARTDDNVIVTGYVEDIRPYLSKALVFIAPIRIGGGMRGKVLEAMAAGIPVVATSLGVEGIEVKDGKHVLIADRPEDFVLKTKRILEDGSLRQQLSSNARKLMEDKYDWSIVYSNLEKTYQKVISESNK